MSIGTQVSLGDLVTGALTGNALSHMILSTGQIDGIELVNIQGLNPDVDTGGGDEIIGEPGGIFTFPTVADEVQIEFLGTGNHAVLLKGLDSNFEKIEEVVPFSNGITFSNQQFIRLNEAIIVTPDIRNNLVMLDIGGFGEIDIAPETNIKRTMVYTVPEGWTASVAQTSVGVGKNKDCDVVFRFRFWTQTGYIDNVGSRLPLFQNYASVEFNNAFLNANAPARTDILLECNTENNNTRVSAFNSILVIKDELLQKMIAQVRI